jgi:hypothetical protein
LIEHLMAGTSTHAAAPETSASSSLSTLIREPQDSSFGPGENLAFA